jgi:hypothetical protein
MRRAARKDANHGEIVETLGRLGCVVVDVSGVACGLDLFVWHRGRWYAFEIKDGEKPPSARRLTDREKKLSDRCRAAGAQYEVIESTADLMRVLEVA